MKRSGFVFIIILLLLTNVLSDWYAFSVSSKLAGLKKDTDQLSQQNESMSRRIRELEAKVVDLTTAAIVPLEKDPDKQKELKQSVENITELKFKEDVPFNVFSKDELAAFLQSELGKEYPSEYFEKYQQAYQRMGLLPADFNLEKSYKSLLGEQVAGLYDLESKKMYLVSDPASGLSESEKEIIIAHELTHAIKDQHFPGFEQLTRKLEAQEDDDAQNAVQALMEGDATLVMTLYGFQHPFGLITAGSAELVRGFLGGTAVYDASPEFLKKSLLFPYEEGVVFVQYHQLLGGMKAVNDLFTNPPLSTEQILHPEKYGNDFPQSVSFDLGSLASQWNKTISFSLGEFETKLWLRQFVDEDHSLSASEGWDGDRVTLLHNKGRNVLLMGFIFDSGGDLDEFRGTVEREYLAKRFPDFKKTDDLFQISDNRFVALKKINDTTLLLVDGDDKEDVNLFLGAVKISAQEFRHLPSVQ